MFYEYTFGTSVCIYYTLHDCRGRERARRRKEGYLWGLVSQPTSVVHRQPSHQFGYPAGGSDCYYSGSLPQQGTYLRPHLSAPVVTILAHGNFFSIVSVCELQTTAVNHKFHVYYCFKNLHIKSSLMNSGLTSGPHGGGDDSPDREKTTLYVSPI